MKITLLHTATQTKTDTSDDRNAVFHLGTLIACLNLPWLSHQQEVELERGLAGILASWHAKYAKSAWVYVGNLDADFRR